MIGIKKGTEYLDLQPGTQLQRERSSPVFLDQTEDGKDSIPGEISYPFTLPLSDNNLRLLGYPDNLPIQKQLQHSVVLEDSGMQISQGNLVIDSVTAHLNKNNLGSLDCHILSNVSEFWQRVKTKKLSELQLGGERQFTWNGYSLVNPGFWKHVHDTWSYNSADDGDYVFSPIQCYDWFHDEQPHFINGWKNYGSGLEMARDENFLSLCPHPYVVYILRCIFNEHGYTLQGDFLNDVDFKQICFESYKAVKWAEAPTGSTVVTPIANITLRLNEHVPPAMTVGEFLVELQKLLPIAFIINDRAKTCTLTLLTDLVNGGARDRTGDFSPSYTLSFEKGDGEPIIYGFERVDDNEKVEDVIVSEYNYLGEITGLDQLPLAATSKEGDLYYVRNLNEYWIYWRQGSNLVRWPKGDNVGSYLTGNQTETIVSNLAVSAFVDTTITAGVFAIVPINQRKGNYNASNLDFEPWPGRIFFYRGRQTFHAGGTMPLATNSIWNFNSSSPMLGVGSPQVGNWSLSYNIPGADYGLIDRFWSRWLPVLEMNEFIKGRLYLKFHEYLQWEWGNVLLINNTPYLIKKITEVLPYNGYIDIEAQRIR